MSSKYINVHTHSNLRSDETNIISLYSHSIGNSTSNIKGYYSVGVHPWDVESVSIEELKGSLKNYFEDQNCVALGEIGLDYHRAIDRNIQQLFFERQLSIAHECHKPVILHVVKSYHDVLRYRSDYEGIWILHAFQGNEDVLRKLKDYPVYFSLGIREINRLKKLNILNSIPLNKLFLETDESECLIEEVYAYYCLCSSYPLERIKKCIFDNFFTVFSDINIQQ
ncbi:TatD family hydrolase [Prolixibacteraceae bacterium]|nr:TatD family hydrolase [Prolixibacteraceae bacterium]